MPFFRSPPRAALLSAAALLACVAPAAQADDSDPPEGESTFALGRVTVTGRSSGPLRAQSVLTSVDVLRGSALQGQATDATWALFALSPGVTLTEFNQGTTSGKLSFRGFNGEGEVNAVKLLIDGVPANSNDGNMPFLDAVFPLELESIEVVRGTNDARHGLYNLAGNVNLVTRQGGNDTAVRLGVGSFNALDVQLARGVEAGPWAQNYFVGAKRSDGWRDHSDSRKFTLGGKWFYSADSGAWRAGLTARHFEHQADEPGYLTQAMSDADPDRSPAYAAADGGIRRTDQLGLQAEGRATASLSWAATAYLNRYDDRRWVTFSGSVAQQERYTQESHTGVRTTLSWRPKVAALHEFALEGGFDAERQDNRSERYTGSQRVRGTQTRDQAWIFNTVGAYVQAVLRPVPRLKVVPAFRVDRVSGHFANRLAGTTAPVNDYGNIAQPKFSVVWTPWDGQAAYANWGRTFQVGIGSASYRTNTGSATTSAVVEPSVNDGWEVGLKFQPASWLDGRLAGWAQTASAEVKRNLNAAANDADAVGRTRRHGVDLQLAARPGTRWEAWAALTVQKALIVQPDASASAATAGKEIDHVPRRVYNAGVDWQATPDWKLSAWLQGQSGYFLERTNSTRRFGGYTLLNLGARRRIDARWALEAQVRNVTERATEYVWWDPSANSGEAPIAGPSLHSRGAPRAFSLALTGTF
jgi:iron complex outermembrane receptor protein